MENEDLNLDFDNIESNVEGKLKAKNRFEQLSEKVILTSKERDEAKANAESLTEAKLNAEKERDFYKDFSANVSKYPNASEFQDKILEKVKGGYSTEDAMVSVLAKEGKLNIASEASRGAPTQAEGGSAPTALGGDKNPNDMNIEDKRSALMEADKSGDLANALFRR